MNLLGYTVEILRMSCDSTRPIRTHLVLVSKLVEKPLNYFHQNIQNGLHCLCFGETGAVGETYPTMTSLLL